MDDEKPINVTMLHSVNMNFRYIRPETYSLMVSMKDEPPITLRMNSQESMWTMVEVFECVGEVEFFASNDYKQFIANESVGAEHSKTAGHYVIKLSPSTNSSLQFARILSSSLNAVFVLRYSYFPESKYPFSDLTLSEKSIKYDFQGD